MTAPYFDIQWISEDDMQKLLSDELTGDIVGFPAYASFWSDDTIKFWPRLPDDSMYQLALRVKK